MKMALRHATVLGVLLFIQISCSIYNLYSMLYLTTMKTAFIPTAYSHILKFFRAYTEGPRKRKNSAKQHVGSFHKRFVVVMADVNTHQMGECWRRRCRTVLSV